MPCLANSPSPIVTWQRPQMARPPQTESMSTPSARAAVSTGVPSGNRPRLPDGVKTRRASGLSFISLTSASSPSLRLGEGEELPSPPPPLLARFAAGVDIVGRSGGKSLAHRLRYRSRGRHVAELVR